MAAIYVNNLIINAGSDFSQSFTLEGSDNSPLNLSGYSINAQMRKWSGSSTAITFESSIEIPSTSGRILISLPFTDTVNIKPGRYIYDIVITDPFEVRSRVIEGMVLVREGATR